MEQYSINFHATWHHGCQNLAQKSCARTTPPAQVLCYKPNHHNMPVFCNEHTFLFSWSLCQMLMHFVGFYPASTQWMSPCSFVLKVYNVTFLCFSGACSYPVYLHLLFARHTGLGCPFGPKHLPDKCQIVLRQKRDKFFSFVFFLFCDLWTFWGIWPDLAQRKWLWCHFQCLLSAGLCGPGDYSNGRGTLIASSATAGPGPLEGPSLTAGLKVKPFFSRWFLQTNHFRASVLRWYMGAYQFFFCLNSQSWISELTMSLWWRIWNEKVVCSNPNRAAVPLSIKHSSGPKHLQHKLQQQ